MSVRNRELSQFGSFIHIEDSTQNIGITSISTPYIGIGTNTPTSKLDVIGDVKVSGVVTASSFVGDGSGLTNISGGGGVSSQWLSNASGIHTTSNVGIGITNPSSKLTVAGDANISGVITATNFYGNLTGTADVATYLSSAANISTGTISTDRLSGTYNINITGSIGYANTSGIATYATLSGIATYATSSGISTYATTAGIATYASFSEFSTSSGVSTSVIGGISSVTQLQVTGISTFTNGPVFIGSGTSTGTASQRLQITGGAYVSSNLGIGTTNPQTRLEINGVLGFGTSNIRIGNNNTGGSITSGTDNFFVGINAGFANTSGSHNIFLGRYSGSCNVSGQYNNFFGRYAGRQNTTGCHNNFLSAYSGNCNSTGSNNNFFGNSSGYCNTIGYSNNFFGRNSGVNNVCGNNNNFLGEDSGYYNISGSENNFIGYSVGSANTTGCCNNFFGYLSGNCNTTGSSNSFYGSFAGRCNTSGNYNSFFGHCAGHNNSTGNYNVVIGAGVLSTPTSNGSNQLVIGAGSTNWIVGTSSYNVGMGVTNPSSKLQVNGTVTATTFSGSGASLTSLNASNLSSGTVPAGVGVTAGSTSLSFIKYNGTTASGGQFDGGTTNPSSTARLNYNGNFYANNFYGDGSNLTALNASEITTGTLPGNRGVTSGSTSSSFIEYNGTTRTVGQFDGGTTDPSSTTRLNYNGNFYATNFYSSSAVNTNTITASVAGTPGIFDRLSTTGQVIAIQYNSVTQGSIAIAGDGTTVNYNTFLGSHWAMTSSGEVENILPGTILETINELVEWKLISFNVNEETLKICYNGPLPVGVNTTVSYEGEEYVGIIEKEEPNLDLEKSVRVKISDSIGSSAVYGVFLSWNNNDDGYIGKWNNMEVASVGNYFIRMNANETVNIGDLVESAGNGCGKVQSDDIIRSKTVGKITSTIKQKIYNDGSYLVTAVLYCG